MLSAILLAAAAGLPSSPVVPVRVDAPSAVHAAHTPPSCLPDGLDRDRTEPHRRAPPLWDLERVRLELLDEVNEQRQQVRRQPVVASHALDRVAQQHAEDMLRQGYYAHRGLDGKNSLQRVLATGYVAHFVAENIAKGLFTPCQAVERWMASRGHRRNILAPEAQEIGFGVAAGDGPQGFEVLWVMVLARPRGTA